MLVQHVNTETYYTNQLEGEPKLNPSVMGALDGNNSLKSDYFLSHEYVDQYAHEVKRRIPKSENGSVEVEIEGDPTDGHAGPATCTDRWRAAMADTVKGMYKAFAKTGVFVLALEEMPIRIQTLLNGIQCSDAQFASWLREEREYLDMKQTESDRDVLGIEYIELLTNSTWEATQRLAAEVTGTKDKARLRQVTHDMWEGMNFLQKELQEVEAQLDIGYQLAVDKLKGLVVQRLVELTKANTSQTGYKMRSHISKALKSWSKAIQHALQVHNKAAQALDPPHPELTWVQIVEYTTIAEVELLCTGACEDIRNIGWADARNHEATICHLKLLWAKEEIVQLNVEIKRLATWVEHEKDEWDQAITGCMEKDPTLANTMKEAAQEHIRINGGETGIGCRDGEGVVITGDDYASDMDDA
ncbi:hypothetical protein JB92DRAFT_3109913 [Gautieria morchelliformis]|nr:hypothetical protein JB92DRAFT_3109913 [Gautieria morchelliformis]